MAKPERLGPPRISLREADRLQRRDTAIMVQEHGCRKCGHADPVQLHRERDYDQGTVIDEMYCPLCGSKWKWKIELEDADGTHA